MSGRPSDLYSIVIKHLADICRLGTPGALEASLFGKWVDNVIEREPVMKIVTACKHELDAALEADRLAALAPVTADDTHENVELRLPAEMVALIEGVAADAAVTRDQAASVITALALRRYTEMPSREQGEGS